MSRPNNNNGFGSMYTSPFKNYPNPTPDPTLLDDHKKLQNLTSNSNRTTIVQVPESATSFANALNLSYEAQTSGLVVIQTPNVPGTYWVDLGDDFQYQAEKAYRENFSMDQFVYKAENSGSTEIASSTQFRIILRPQTQLIVTFGTVPVGNDGAGEPYIFVHYWNRWDQVTLTPPTPLPFVYENVIDARDYWFFSIYFNPNAALNDSNGFINTGNNLGLSTQQYNQTVDGQKTYIQLISNSI